MDQSAGINEYILSLISSKRMQEQVVFHKVLPENPPVWSKPENPWPEALNEIMQSIGISDLYQHQARAVDWIRAGKHVVVATPTASGKTLIYNLPVLEKILFRPDSKALYLFPLKALAQDQLRAFEAMTAFYGTEKPSARIYDGDTSGWHRKRIRDVPPNVLMTNPEMLHLSLLPHHEKWAGFLSGLEIVVVDEVHTYRGVMGSHMAQVFRRLNRVCAHYSVSPTFVFSSATIANPTELTRELTGLDVNSITESGAPQGRRHVIFMNPVSGPAQTALLMLKAALHRGLRTIVYTQSRKLAELIAVWAGSKSGEFASRISVYRAGLLPEERREIEAKLANGELLAVISTSALELGIDIGDLDLCILVGYPGTVMATWQRGGRVGRGGQESAIVMIAGEDALDQYFMRNPQNFISRETESAVINPYNPEILSRHLPCAAVELPLKEGEPFISEKPVQKSVRDLEETSDLLRSADGNTIYSKRKSPHRHVDLRGAGNKFNIICSRTGQQKGEIDGFRAFKETHPGAIYLHNGKTFLVDTLDLATKTAKVSEARANYYTRVMAQKDTEILEIYEKKTAWGIEAGRGRLKVTDQVNGYEKWSIHAKKRLNRIPLDLPPQIFETEGLWFKIPFEIQKAAEIRQLHFMGGIHAIEHAAIGILPLFVLTDRNDLGGISTTFHPQLDSAAVFIYDGIPGGAGLSRQAFGCARDLLTHTLKIIKDCSCETGCPSCVHSPKCGSGNRPIDKRCSIFLLDQIISGPRDDKIDKRAVKTIQAKRSKSKVNPSEKICYGVFDIETQRSSQEVGGWHRADRMGISCVVLYDSKKDRFYEFLENQVPQLIGHLQKLDLVVGFNIKRFDYQVLKGYSDFDFKDLPTLDILEEIHKHLGYRLSLNNLASVTLGTKKSADGLAALRWWKQGKILKIIDYCKVDVEITRDLFLYGREKQYLLFNNKAGNAVRVPVKW